MRRTRGWTGMWTSVVALGLVAAVAGRTRADAISPTSTVLAYDTTGSTIGTSGVTSSSSTTTPAITFVPLAGGTFMSPSSLDLGYFQTSALASGQSVTYNNTPFDIKYTVDGVNGSTMFQPNGTPIDLTGVLNGTLSGPSQSTVVATFNAPASATFATDLYTNTLAVSGNPLTIVPSTSYNGLTTAQAVLTTTFTNTAPVPEPSTIVLFTATIAGLGFRYRLRKAKTAE